MTRPTQLFIGGRFRDARSGKTFPTVNPATGEVIAEVAAGDAPDIDDAVTAARAAFGHPAWRDMEARERARLLGKLGDLIEKHADELALTETLDNGKPISESRRIDIPAAAETFRYYAGWCARIGGETIPVPGFGETAGRALAAHPAVDKISFTGSTAVGREIVRASADTLKKVSLELGGKSPNIVFADADLDAAARGAASGIFYGKGEVCNAGSRLLVEKSVHDALMERLLARARRLEPGDPLDPKTRLGALVSEAQMERVLEYCEIGRREGAIPVLPGGRVGDRGCFVRPAIFDAATPSMRIAQEEIFGPVLTVISFEGEEECVRLANSTIYGLAAAVWTRDIGRAHRLARRLEAGTVWINAYGALAPESPFGGYRQSGYGRELGREGIELYSQVKSVWVALD